MQRRYCVDAVPASKSAKKKTCKNGWSCGSTCISKSKECRSGVEGQAKNYADWMAGQAKSGKPASKKPKSSSSNKSSKQNTDSSTKADQLGDAPKYKPLMSKEEADSYVKGTAWSDRVFFHGSTASGVNSITKDGADPDRTQIGMFGKGFYVTPNKTGDDAEKNGNEGLGADFYATLKQSVTDEPPRFVEMRLKANNPKTFRDFGEFQEFIQQNGVNYDTSFGEGYTQQVTDLMKKKGHDAIEIRDSGEIIVYNKESVAAYNTGDY